MNIFIASDDKYVYPARVMLTSLLTNNTFEPHLIHFMYSNIKQENIEELKNVVEGYNSKFYPIKISAEMFGNFVKTERFPVEIYYRLIIPSLLPENENRALWLDIDLVVNDSLRDFYYQDFEDNFFVACKEIENQKAHLNNLGLPDNSDYINSGVILFNLPLMRKYSIEDYYKFFSTHKESIIWPDQDILNGVFSGRIKVLDGDRYNVQVSNWRFHNEYDLEKCAIIHYIGNNKPWFKTYTNSAAEIWDKYYIIAFNKRNGYLLYKKIDRNFITPLRESVIKYYNNTPALKKIRNIARK